MRPVRRTSLYRLTGLLAVMLAAGPAWASSLEQAVMRGLARHPEVQAAQAEVRMAQTEVAMSRNSYLPTLGASAGPAAAGLGYDVSVSQTLYDWGQTRGVVDQKRALLEQQRANLEVVRDDVALQITEVYLDVASARAQLSMLDGHLERLNSLAEMARTRVEGRYSDESETGRVGLAVATAQGAQARLRGTLAEATDLYRLLVDEPPNGVRLPQPPAFLETVANEGALEAAVTNSPLYRKAALSVRVADASVREAQAARYPRLNLEGSVQRREIGGRMIDDSTIGIRFRLSTQPGLSALQRPQLEAQRREVASWNAQTAARNLKRTVSSLGATEGALDARIAALGEQAGQAERVRDLYREQFLVGRRDIQDLVIMETEQFEAERQLVELTIERLRLQYRAAAQLGLLASAMTDDAASPPAGDGQ